MLKRNLNLCRRDQQARRCGAPAAAQPRPGSHGCIRLSRSAAGDSGAGAGSGGHCQIFCSHPHQLRSGRWRAQLPLCIPMHWLGCGPAAHAAHSGSGGLHPLCALPLCRAQRHHDLLSAGACLCPPACSARCCSLLSTCAAASHACLLPPAAWCCRCTKCCPLPVLLAPTHPCLRPAACGLRPAACGLRPAATNGCRFTRCWALQPVPSWQ